MILVFTGAGISKASGIDTFMERPDIRNKLYRDYAMNHPQSYNETIKALVDVIGRAKPNQAHRALAGAGLEVITMNIDGLHEKAGSTDVIALHGTMPKANELDHAHTLYGKPVLYGDAAPNYQVAIDRVLELTKEDIFLVIGASRHTQIAVQLRELAHYQGAQIIEIQADAENAVPKQLEALKNLHIE